MRRRAALEPILERGRHFRRDPRERDQAVTDVAGRKDAILLPQDSRAPAVVRRRDDRGDPGGRGKMAAQPREDDRQPGATAQGDDHHGRLHALRHPARSGVPAYTS